MCLFGSAAPIGFPSAESKALSNRSSAVPSRSPMTKHGMGSDSDCEGMQIAQDDYPVDEDCRDDDNDDELDEECDYDSEVESILGSGGPDDAMGLFTQ